MKRIILIAVCSCAALLCAAQEIERQDTLSEAVISAASPAARLAETLSGVERIDIDEIAKVPVIFGEKDIIKSLQLLPGVKSEGEGLSGFEVRGGTSAQNLILLDGAPVYNAGHAMGVFSAFNDDALSGVTLYKGQIPSAFGGASSSVLDISTHQGDMYRWHFGGSIGLLSARLGVEGPIVRDKLSIYLGARRSYMDSFLIFSKKYKGNKLYFYDFNARVDWKATAKDNFSITFFRSDDVTGIKDFMNVGWNNTSVTGRWLHREKNVYFNSSVVWSSFENKPEIDILGMHLEARGYIRHSTARENITILAGSHKIHVGGEITHTRLNSAEWDISGTHLMDLRKGGEGNVWAEDEWAIAPFAEVSVGFRLGMFMPLDGRHHIYFSPEPRVGAKFSIGQFQTIRGGYCRSSQNVHALRNANMALPFDRFCLTSAFVKPEISDQGSLGYAIMIPDGSWDFSLEGYYKGVQNVYDYLDGETFISDIDIEKLIKGGRGRAYGVEVAARKNTGAFTGWAAYTLSFAETRIEGINGGRWYRSNNDQRHNINLVAMYSLRSGWNFSAAFTYISGRSLTVPSAKYMLDGNIRYYNSERNGYRTPPTHHLDIGASHTKHKGRITRVWTFSIYNVYNNYNPFAVTFRDDEKNPSGSKAIQTSLFGIIPSVSFSLKF